MAGDILQFLAETPVDNPDQKPADFYAGKGNIVEFLAQPDQLPRAVEKGLATPPDQAANVIRLQAKTGLPQSVIERNMEYVEAESNKRDFNSEDFRKENPKLAEWMESDKNRVAVSREDIEAMSSIEKVFGAFSAMTKGTAGAIATAGKATFASVPRLASGTYGFAAQGLDTLGLKDTASYLWEESANQEAVANSLRSEEQGFIQNAVGSGFESVGTTLMTWPLAIGRSATAALGVIGLQAGGTSFLKGHEAGIDPYTNLMYGTAQAGSEVVTEKFALTKLLFDLDAGSPFWKVLRNQMLSENFGEQINTVVQDFNDWAILTPEKTAAEFINERPSAALSTFISTAVGVGVQTGVMHGAYRMAEKHESTLIAQRRSEFLKSLGENLNGSTILSKSPESVKSYIEHLKKDSDIQNAYIPVDAWDRLFQTDASRAAIDILGSASQYTEARAVNGDIVIPLEVYAEKLVGTAFHDQLMPDITFRQGELSARDAEEAGKNLAGEIDAEAKTIEDSYKADDSMRKVYNDVLGQMLGMKATRQEAERIATLESQRQATRAARLGIDPYELWQERPKTIQRELPTVLKNKEVDINLDPMLDELRSGSGVSDKQIYGQSLVEFLKEKGGLLDQGAELSNMNVDELGENEKRKPFARNLVQKDGMNLDDAAALAAELGYIDERDINKLLDAIDRETRGEAVYSPSKEDQSLVTREKELNELFDYLGSIGADLKTMDNATVRKMIREREGESDLLQTQTESISPETEAAMIEAYNADLPSQEDQLSDASENNYWPEGWEYRTETVSSLEYSYGDDRADWPEELVAALGNNEEIVIVSYGETFNYYAPENAPSKAEFNDLVADKIGVIKPVSSLDDMLLESRLNGHVGESATSEAFKVMAEDYGWTASERGTRYFEIWKDNPDPVTKDDYPTINLHVRVSDHSKTAGFSRPDQANNIHINIAPSDGRGNEYHGADTFESALWTMRNASVDADGSVLVSGKDIHLYQTSVQDPLYTPALRVAHKRNSASMSMLRRNYPQITPMRAQSLLDKMVADGYIEQKSHVKGTFNATDKLKNLSSDDLLFQTGNAKGLYSQLRVAIRDMSDKVFQGTAVNVKQHLMSNLGKYGIKKDEIFWTGLDEFLTITPKVSKTDVLAFLDENAVQVKDVVLGADPNPMLKARELAEADGHEWDGLGTANQNRYRQRAAGESITQTVAGEPKFADRVLPGGRDYRELLITLPAKTPAHELRSIAQMREFLTQNKPLADSLEGMTDVEKLKALNKKLAKEGATPTFTSSHYPDTPNILAHVRLNTRDDAQGRSGTFAEEFQSDWSIAQSKNKDTTKAPFVTSATGKGTTAHTLLSMKKVILHAIEQGHEFVSWTTGKQQKDRYSLSKQVDSIKADSVAEVADLYFVDVKMQGGEEINLEVENGIVREGDFKGKPLEEIIGKEMAGKIIGLPIGEKQTYTGLELDIGGEWADTLYGDENGLDANGKPSLMTQAANEVARQLGVELKVDAIDISISPTIKSLAHFYDWAEKNYPDMSRIQVAGEWSKGEGGKITQEFMSYTEPTKQPSFTITPAIRSKVTSAGIPLFQTEFNAPPGSSVPPLAGIPEDALGMYSRSENVITLLKKANPSTVLHELGHSWLEELRLDAMREGAPQQLIDDWNTIKAWAKIGDTISVDSHEQFARGIEAYVMEGKSPSAELQPVFSRFKSWLVRIYKQIASLGVDVSPEVRGVFDRMLATDEQISLAREIQGYAKPLLNEEGMTAVEYQIYQKINEKAKNEAEDATRAKVMGELLREQAAWWKKASAAMREEVAAEVDALPAYRALSWLRKGLFPDGTTLEGIEPTKLSKDALVQRYGAPFLARLPKPYIYQVDGGLHPDVAAEYLGFGTGEELVKALAETKPRNELIDAETDQRMKAKYGDMMVDGSIADEADFQVNNDRQAEVFMYEMKVLKRRGSTRNISPKEVFQQIARSIIQDKKVGDLDPGYYEHAARKAGQEAEKALLGKDMKMGLARNMDLAFDAKQRQMLNLYLFKEAFLAKARIDTAQDRFLDMFKKDEKLAKTRNMDMVNAARAISALHGIGGTEKNALQYLEQMREYDPETYNDMKMSVDIATSDSKPFKQLTVAEFGMVQESIDGLWELSRLSQQITINDQKVLISDAIDELRPRMQDLSKGKDLPGYKKAITENEKAGQWLLGQKAKFSMMEWWVEFMDSGKFDGPFRKILQTEVRKGIDEYRVKRAEVREKIVAILEEHSKSFTSDKIYSSDLDYTFGAGETKGRLAKDLILGSKERGRLATAGELVFSSTGSGRAELLAAISHTGNQSNFERLLRGRRWGEFREDGSLDTTKWDAAIKKMWADGTLTKADYDVIQSIWNLNEELKPGAQKAHKEMYGYYFEEITAQPFNTPFGTYKGGYVPAIYDSFISDDAATREDREALENQSLGTIMPAPAKGFTKSRKSRYAAPLKLDIRALPSHMDKVLMLSYIAPRVREVSRMVMSREFRDEMNLVDPTIISEMIIPWLDRTVKQMVEIPSTSKVGRMTDKFFREVRARSGRQIMALHVVNAMQQVTGLSAAAVKLKNPGRMKESLVRYIQNPTRMAEEINMLSKFMQEVANPQMADLTRRMDNILLNPTKYEKASEFAKEHGYFMQVATQNAVNYVVWDAAYNEALGDNPNKKRAIEYANSRVRLTQGTFHPEDISRFEAGSAFFRSFTMLYRYFNTQLNLNYYEQKQSLERGGFNGVKRGLFVHTLGFMIPSVVGMFIWQVMSGADLDEDDDGYLDDFLQLLFFGQIQYATAMIPFAGPVTQMGINQFNDKWYDDRISASPAISVFEATARAPYSVYMSMAEDGSNKRAIQDSLTAIGMATGLPLKPLGRPLGYLADIEQGEVEPSDPVDFTRGLITGKSQ